MAPKIEIAPLRVRLENAAAWHITEMERAYQEGDHERAAHHDAMAFRLFKQAKAAGGHDVTTR